MIDYARSFPEVARKKRYVTPTLKQWGTLVDLTGVGNTHPGNDAKCGSVLPPGLGDARCGDPT